MTTNGTCASRDGSEVVLGVDTHLDFHVAVALDGLGRRLGELAVTTTEKGYEGLLCWAQGFGHVGRAGVEGTSSYGAGLARHLKAAQIPVFEVERPKRRHLRRRGKSDSPDAEAAARAVLAGEAAGVPKSGHGGGQIQEGNHEVPKTLRGPGGLPCADLERLPRRFLRGRGSRRSRDRRHLTYRGVATSPGRSTVSCSRRS